MDFAVLKRVNIQTHLGFSLEKYTVPSGATVGKTSSVGLSSSERAVLHNPSDRSEYRCRSLPRHLLGSK